MSTIVGDAAEIGTGCAAGSHALAQGTVCEATGESSCALGYQSRSYGDQGFTSGRSCYAFGANSSATGEDSVAWDYNARADGFDCQAFGPFSAVHNYRTITSDKARNSNAFGNHSLASRPNQMVTATGGFQSPGDCQTTFSLPMMGQTPGLETDEIGYILDSNGAGLWTYAEDGKAYSVLVSIIVAAVIDGRRISARLRRRGETRKEGGVVAPVAVDTLELITSDPEAAGFTLLITEAGTYFRAGSGVVARARISAKIELEEVLFPDFTLRDVAGITLDLDAEAGIVIDGGAVSRWRDRSSRGDSYEQSVAGYRPTMIVADHHGWHAVRFDGADDLLVQTLGNLGDVIDPIGFTAFAVLRWRAGGSSSDPRANGPAIADTSGAFGYAVQDNAPVNLHAQSFAEDAGGLRKAEHVAHLDTTYVGTWTHTDDDRLFTMRDEGNGPLPNAFVANVGDTTPLTGILRLGANRDASAFGKFDLLRLVVYGRSLSVPEIFNVVGALMAQYNSAPPAPKVVAVSPDAGDVGGGTLVAIKGSGFRFGATVAIGGVDATDIFVQDPETILARTGAKTGGSAIVDVVVTNTDAQGSGASGSGLFVYTEPLTAAVVFGSSLKRWYLENYDASTGTYTDETGTENAVQSTAGLRPTAGSINGHTCASFDGTKGLKAGGSTAPFTNACSIFGVAKTNSLAAIAYLWCKTFGAQAFGVGAADQNHKLQAWINSSTSPASAISDVAVDDGNPFAWIMTWDGTTVRLVIDGVVQAETQAKASPLNTTGDLLSIGCAMLAESVIDYRFNGDLGNTGLANVCGDRLQLANLTAGLKAWAGL